MRHEGFHGRVGFGRRPALIVVDADVVSLAEVVEHLEEIAAATVGET